MEVRRLPRASFQSTRPARGATFASASGATGSEVSIHAPRAGRDQWRLGWLLRCGGFNPRAPRGARRLRPRVTAGRASFQSTRPARGATSSTNSVAWWIGRFNPRAPRGARPRSWSLTPRTSSFNPRAPRGARRRSQGGPRRNSGVSIHAPRAGRDEARAKVHSKRECFNPRAPRGARRPA